MLPSHYVELFENIAAERGDGSIVLPFAIWREAFINDADLATAQHTYELLNPHPFKTVTDRISLKQNPAEMPNCLSEVIQESRLVSRGRSTRDPLKTSALRPA